MNLKERLEELGISQRELARRAGIDDSYVCGIINGKRNPSIKIAIAIGKVVGVEVDPHGLFHV